MSEISNETLLKWNKEMAEENIRLRTERDL